MASHMVVAPSRDTLFIRGFTGRRDIQDIREYFERQAGCDCTIEFFKQDDMNDALYVALRFETRDIAKDILNRFDDTEVMGDRVEMSWFKDLRKAKQQAAYERQQRYGHMGYNNYGGYRRYGGHHNQHQRRMSPNRGRYQRSRDRSYSRSASRSRSRSRSPSRGRSREKRNVRPTTSTSRSSSPEQSKSASKLRSKVQSSDKPGEGDQDANRSASSPSKRLNLEDIKPPNSPDDRSPGRQSARSQDIKPSPKLRRDQSEERKVSRMEDPRSGGGKRGGGAAGGDDERMSTSRMSEEPMSQRSQHDEPRMSRMADDKFDDVPSRDLSRGQAEQRIRRQELERDELAPRSKTRNDSLLDAQDVGERRRGGRGLSPSSLLEAQDRYGAGSLKGDDERMRGRGGAGALDSGPSSTMFWDDLDEPRKSKMLSKDRTGDSLRGSLRGMMDDDDLLPKERGMRGIDDDDRFGYGSDMLRRAAGARPNRDFDFSQDALGMIQEKKKEIERVYKNDCETFVTVVKMLISKEPSLEEKLQYSLRDNLKEIGQRCILDLREYMDRLREHDSLPLKMP